MSSMPTRVIDVRSDGQDPRLHLTNSRKGEWVTLSHCWGKEKFLVTTTKNLERHLEGIALTDLPPNFQDAIRITRKLGYQYIWIDSLCILQDSADDWRAESVKMGGIYKHGVLNISADAASDAFQGIFRSCDRDRLTKDVVLRLPCHSPRHRVEGTLYVTQCDHTHRENGRGNTNEALLGENVIQSRSWVLQESVLSPRRLRYSARQMAWACRCADLIEQDPLERTDAREHWDLAKFSVFSILPSTLVPHLDLPDFGQPHQRVLRWWYEVVQDYTIRKLTYEKDRFPALEGLAREFSERTGYRYLSGIWKEDYLRGLLWRTRSGLASDENVPSWSWAASIPDHRKPEDPRGILYDVGNFSQHGPIQPSEFVEILEVDITMRNLPFSFQMLKDKDIDEFASDEERFDYIDSLTETVKKSVLTLRGPTCSMEDLVKTLPGGKRGQFRAGYIGPQANGPELNWTTGQSGTYHDNRSGIMVFLDQWERRFEDAEERTGESVLNIEWNSPCRCDTGILEGSLLLQVAAFCNQGIISEDDTDVYQTWCLVLRPLWDIDGFFRRIGLMKIEAHGDKIGEPHLWQGKEKPGWERMTVKII